MANVAIRFHRLAAREYRLALAWYAGRSAFAAGRFRAEIKRVIQRIAQAPDQGTIYRGPYRWMRLRRYPYLLYYALVDPTQVILYALAHGRRRPSYWLRRTRP
jgi:plasmid stabilization system protein ParE